MKGRGKLDWEHFSTILLKELLDALHVFLSEPKRMRKIIFFRWTH